MNYHAPHKRFFALSLLSSLLVAGCDAKKGADAAQQTSPASSAAVNEVKEGPKGPCEQLASKVCEEAGEKSPTCASSRSAFNLLSDKTCKTGVSDFAFTSAQIKKKAKVCDTLIETLCNAVGPDTKTCSMVREKTKTFPPDQCTKMLTETDDIIKGLKAEELRNHPLSTELRSLIAAPGAPSFGPVDAKVTIVEFSDFECPYCSRAASVTSKIKEKYGDKVRFVFRQFPLSFHKNAQAAAEASMAANAQGKFWELHDLMFENQRALGPEQLEDYAKRVGLDVAQFKQEMEAHKYAEYVKKDIDLGGQVAVGGTPTLFINGERVGNPTDFEFVSQAIDKLLGS